MSLRRACALLRVLDTDTLQVEWEGQPSLVRLMDVDPERAAPGGAQPATEFGRQTLRFIRESYLKDVDEVQVEFPGEKVGLSNSGRLLAYVHVRGENFNAQLVREGYSPCFCKYGHPRIHREEMERAEIRARVEGRGVWGGMGGRDYGPLTGWWHLRAGQVDDYYRHVAGLGEDIFGTRLFYEEIIRRARKGMAAQVFAELVRAFVLSDGATLIQLGSPHQPLCLYLGPESRSLAGFLEREFIGFGKPNYLYFNGGLSLVEDQPQIHIERIEQFSTFPAKTAV